MFPAPSHWCQLAHCWSRHTDCARSIPFTTGTGFAPAPPMQPTTPLLPRAVTPMASPAMAGSTPDWQSTAGAAGSKQHLPPAPLPVCRRVPTAGPLAFACRLLALLATVVAVAPAACFTGAPLPNFLWWCALRATRLGRVGRFETQSGGNWTAACSWLSLG